MMSIPSLLGAYSASSKQMLMLIEKLIERLYILQFIPLRSLQGAGIQIVDLSMQCPQNEGGVCGNNELGIEIPGQLIDLLRYSNLVGRRQRRFRLIQNIQIPRLQILLEEGH